MYKLGGEASWDESSSTEVLVFVTVDWRYEGICLWFNVDLIGDFDIDRDLMEM